MAATSPCVRMHWQKYLLKTQQEGNWKGQEIAKHLKVPPCHIFTLLPYPYSPSAVLCQPLSTELLTLRPCLLSAIRNSRCHD